MASPSVKIIIAKGIASSDSCWLCNPLTLVEPCIAMHFLKVKTVHQKVENWCVISFPATIRGLPVALHQLHRPFYCSTAPTSHKPLDCNTAPTLLFGYTLQVPLHTNEACTLSTSMCSMLHKIHHDCINHFAICYCQKFVHQIKILSFICPLQCIAMHCILFWSRCLFCNH